MRVLAITMLLVACSAPQIQAKHVTGRHHGADRMGTHGMALFGKGTYFMAHIPTMSRPHNEQLVMRIDLENSEGAALDADFSQAGHSIRPKTHFSLDDLAMGKNKSFKADIFAGNFEHGAPVVHADVTVRIEAVLIARNLPGTDAADSHYVLQGGETYLLNRITAAQNRQHIRRVTLEKPLPGQAKGFALNVSVGQDENGGPTLVLRKAGSQQRTTTSLLSSSDLWCLVGPDFFQPCP